MYKKAILLLAVLMAASSVTLMAHDRKKVRINEVMVENTNSVLDEYGQRGAWIEIFNGNFSPIEISSVYLTNDRNQPKKYPVPLGDARTRMGKRQSLIFFADGQPTRGTFHTSFALTPGQDNWIGIYDADGINLIDSVTVPASLTAGQSYALAPNAQGVEVWQVRANRNPHDYITPGETNFIKDENARVKYFAEKDASGFALTIIAMGIVFCALAVLCLAFYLIGFINKRASRSRKAEALGTDECAAEDLSHDTGEEIAAIAMALAEHLDAHDRESTVLTINKVRRAYSPWSSHIYGLRQIPVQPTHKK